MMKKSVLFATVFAGVFAIGASSVSATVPEKVVPKVELDTVITNQLKHAESYTDDGYVEVLTTPSHTTIRASSRDHLIKQITFTLDGTRIDGAVCGCVFAPSAMSYELVSDWTRDDKHYHTYKNGNGEVLMVTTVLGRVVSLDLYSKTISNC